MDNDHLNRHLHLRAYACIDQKNLIRNLDTLKALHPNKQIILMLKANAYGHGLLKIAELLDGRCDYFGVASVEEGVKLRNHGVIKSQIMIFSGFFCAKLSQALIEFKLIPVIHSLYQIDDLKNYLRQEFAEIWLKVNTGMNRLGLNQYDFEKAYQQLAKKHTINVMTHLAESENPDPRFTQQQLACFYQRIRNKNFQHISAFNSSAVLFHPFEDHTDTIRVGLALYGALTLSKTQYSKPLAPVMSLYSRIIAIQHLKPGDSVGYNRQYIADKIKKIAIVSIGYGDGYPQMTPNGTPVIINNQRYPTVGKVSMDLMAVDITNAPETITIGTSVMLFGSALPIEEVAHAIGTSPYALMTGISPRVQRVYE
ncbi:alanine racemase [Facilibium subflavum]|uniref:alanine racemase n=1 Tax=Facilibium subflavum TaxID=2219058 RepID=UPI000E658295|nr:alanine racemase [Facilibium subflavum]